jgi:hypothetical protein
MPKPYNAWKYFFPPRSSVTSIWGDELHTQFAEAPDAVGQYKLNGNRNMVVVHPDRQIKFWTRHTTDKDKTPNDPIASQYQAQGSLLGEKLLALAPKGHWTIFDTELLHYKTKFVKDTVYVFDVLVWESQHLIDVPYRQRYDIIHGLLGDAYVPLSDPGDEERAGAALGRHNLYIAQNIPVAFWQDAWRNAQKYEFVEGLIFKRMGGISRLEPGHTAKNNSSYMCKLRKPNKNSIR